MDVYGESKPKYLVQFVKTNEKCNAAPSGDWTGYTGPQKRKYPEVLGGGWQLRYTADYYERKNWGAMRYRAIKKNVVRSRKNTSAFDFCLRPKVRTKLTVGSARLAARLPVPAGIELVPCWRWVHTRIAKSIIAALFVPQLRIPRWLRHSVARLIWYGWTVIGPSN